MSKTCKAMTSKAPPTAPLSAPQVPQAPTLKGLTPKKRRFVRAYLNNQNAVEAALKAGYTQQTAEKYAFTLLGKLRPIVAPLLEAQECHLAKLSGITKERWLREVQHLAFFDIRRLIDSETGTARDISTLTVGDAAAISGLQVTDEFAGRGEDRVHVGVTKKFKLCDKLKALELFGKATGFYVERTDVHVKGPLADVATSILLKMQDELEHRVKAIDVVPVKICAEKP